MNITQFVGRVTETEEAGMGGAWIFTALAVEVVSIIAFWKVFVKAKKPGWASLIPIYNMYIMVKIAGRPGWWLLLYLIPVVNIIVHLIIALDTAKAFGKSSAFGFFGLWMFSLIGYIMLGYGDAKYKGVPKH